MFTRKLFTILALAATFLSTSLMLQSATALAANKSFIVTSTVDSQDTNPGDGKCRSTTGGCTLRAAIEEANSDLGQDVIYLKSNATYPLSSHLEVFSNLIIFGGENEDVGLVADGGNHRVMEVMPGTSVGIADVVIASGNQSQGGGILNHGSLELVRVYFFENHANTEGGGLYNYGTVTMYDSKFEMNVDTYNVTIARNTANLQKNGSDGGGAFNFGGTLTLRHTLIADNLNASQSNFVSDDCGGTMTYAGSNYIESPNSCTFVGGSAVGADPDLAPLGYNFGLTPTHSFESASGAVDSGTDGACVGPGSQYLINDQRGFVRVADGNGNGTAHCDMGALEYNAPNPCAAKPGKPTIVAPDSGIVTNKRTFLLEWNPTECATYYKVVMRKNGKKGTKVHPPQFIKVAHWITAKLPKHQTYFWKVQACNGYGCGKGKFYTFTIHRVKREKLLRQTPTSTESSGLAKSNRDLSPLLSNLRSWVGIVRLETLEGLKTANHNPEEPRA